MVSTLINDFRKYLDVVEYLKENKKIDFTRFNSFPPVTLLTIMNYCQHNILKDCSYNLPSNYYMAMIKQFSSKKDLFFKKLDFDNLTSYWEELSNSFPKIDSNILFVLFYEIITNSLEYSRCKNFYVMGYNYPNSPFIDLCCIDDGISIPKSFEIAKIPSKTDSEAIFEAINGKSEKIFFEELASNGLNRLSNIITFGFKTELLIASRGGLCSLTSLGAKLYDIGDYSIQGTLIAMRFNEKIKKEDLLKSLNPKLIHRIK